jgi:hypothetical protein
LKKFFLSNLLTLAACLVVSAQEVQSGIPSYDNVGHQGVNDASLLAQHSEPEFLHWFLEFINV